MKGLQQWFDEYGESHQNGFNKFMHWICVPSIFFSLIGLLAAIPHAFLSDLVPTAMAPYTHFGTLLIVFGLLFYLRLSFSMFLGMAAVSALTLWGVANLVAWDIGPLWLISLLIFAIAWVGQFIGHKVEGQKPSFFQDLQFLMIGPAWLLGFIYRKVGLPY